MLSHKPLRVYTRPRHIFPVNNRIEAPLERLAIVYPSSCLTGNTGRIRRPRGFGTLEEHGQSSSKMTLFPFATQATERVPGASIEKPRVWVINLAAY